MSLSRPARFPILKLPWLCIEPVIKSWNVVDLIFFALISKKTRRIVKSFKIPLNGIGVYLTFGWAIQIRLGNSNKNWFFNPKSWFKKHIQHLRKDRLVLQKNAIPFYTSRTNHSLISYTYRNTINALKMAMEFLNEVFNCSIETVEIDRDNFPESGNIVVKSTVNLWINQNSTQPFDYAQSQKLNLLLENLEVTDTCNFLMDSTEKGFYVDPKLFKCKKLMFFSGSAAWVNRKILMQFEVPQLKFYGCSFPVKDILSFVTNWFRSDNKKLEYLFINFRRQVSLEEFQTEGLNPVPLSERNRILLSESFSGIDFSKGLEIVRHDGLKATIHVGEENFMFYIWHDQ